MASPITHIVLTEKIYDKFFKDKNRQEFFIGTSFPDIRYLGVIKREETHLSGFKINDLALEDSFFAGFKFHALLDRKRNNFLLRSLKSFKKEKTFLEKFSLNPVLANRALKLFEDELFYNKITNWKEYISFLDKILPSELEFGIEKKEIKRWHSALQNYFSQKPNQKSRKEFFNAINFPQKEAEKVNSTLKALKKGGLAEKMINKLYNEFEDLF